MILKIKDKLKGNPDLINDILLKLDLENIKPPKNNEIRWGDNNGSKINIETLSYASFSHGHKGDILTLVSVIKGIELGDSIKWLAKELDITVNYNDKVDVILPFQGFFKQYGKVRDNDISPPKTYPIERLNEFTGRLNTLWLDDNISLQTQELFNIGLDFDTNRISIGWKDVNGDLVGIMGRLNKKELSDKDMKYLPIIPFNKSKVLYGLDINYEEILRCGCVIIVESEKSVLRAYEMGFRNVVALGGNNISERHSALIKSLCVDVVISLDEGIELSYGIEQAMKCKIENPFFSNEVYVMDVSELPQKQSVFDMDEVVIKEYLENKLIYI